MSKFLRLLFVVVLLTATAQQSVLLANDDKKKKEKVQKKEPVNKDVDFTSRYFDERSDSEDPEVQKQRARAASSVSELDAQQRYVDFLSPADLNRLPIGFKKKIGNTTIKIAVSSAVFTPQYAELTVYAKIDIPEKNNSGINDVADAKNPPPGKSIFFGIKGLKLSKDGGIIGSAKLVLMGDYAIPMNGGKSSLVLKGGMDITTGQAIDKTYISISCNGFNELGIAADIEFPRSLFIPTDNSGNQIAGLVKGSFSTVVSSWNDIVANVSLSPFEIKGLDGVGFKIDNAVVDLSDYRNSADIVYPVGYKEKYLGNDATTLNLWRGVYAKELRVTLPASFNDRTTTNRVSFGAQNMIIDNNGVTGLFYAENILPLEKGSAGGWKFSVDSFRVALEANRLLRAGFGGRVGLPINKDADPGQTETQEEQKRKYLGYSAVMSSSGEYLCRVVTKDSMQFDVWKANVILKPNSYIELAGTKAGFKPSAMLHGSMNMSSSTSTSGNQRLTKILDFKGIEFQGLLIKTDAPYVSAQYFGYNGAIKLGIIPVSIDSIALKSFSPTELGVGFNLKVNLQDNAFSGKTRLFVIGKYNQEQGLSKWKYDRLKIEDITIKAKIGVMTLDGTIAFLDDDPKYGDGFRGQINLAFDKPEGLGLSVTALFGNKGFRYWFVDGMLSLPGQGLGTGVFNINGFGGGAYYRMKKEGFEPTLSPTGLEYVPDSTAGLGVRASVLFNVGSDKLDHGQATFEVAFNRHGGMRYLGFYGYAQIMSPLKVDQLPGGNILGFVQNEFKKVEAEMKTWGVDKLEKSIAKKILQPTAAAEDMYKGKLDASFDVDFRAIVGINYDFENRTLHANFDLYVSTPGGVISGVGAGGRAGWAVLHVAPDKWYMHMGTPTDPIGIKIALGPISVQTSAYFMIGHDLPAFPKLPAAVQAILTSKGINYESNIGVGEEGDIKVGKGIAFGAGVQVSTGDIKFLILYANFQAGMGFDVMVKDYSGYACQETGNTPGIRGWYAQGRVYAYLQGECGIRIKLGPFKKKIPILKAGAVAILEARLPNPSWFGGLFNVNVEILGGLVKVNVNLKFSFGSECVLIKKDNSNGNIDFDEFRVVTGVTPSNNAQNVSLFARPVVSCLTKPEAPFSLPPDDDGGGEERIKPHISSIVFVKGTESITGTYKLSADGSTFTISPDASLVALTDYVLNIKINYQKQVSGNWVNVTNDDGTEAAELTTVKFKTGDNPPFIDENNIGFMYPYINQKFFYKGEDNAGRILLYNTQNELFSSFTSWKARFTNVATKQVVAETIVQYNSANRFISYPIPTGLQPTTGYKIEILGEGYLPGSLITDPTRPILQFNFTTSAYNTLADKINALQAGQQNPVVGRVQSDVIDLQARVSQYEGFDVAEMTGIPVTANMPLVDVEAVLDNNPYYQSKIQPLIRYPTFFSYAGITISRDPADFGLIPTRAMSISSYYLNAAQGSNYNTILYDRSPFIYDLNKVFNGDFIELRTRIVNAYMSNVNGGPTSVPMYEWYRPCFFCSRYQRLTQPWVDYFNSAAYRASLTSGDINKIPMAMRDIVTKPFPFMSKGDYNVRFQLRRPIAWSGWRTYTYAQPTATLFTYKNPIETLFSNELQTKIYTRNNCSSNEQGGTVTYSIAPGSYTSLVSQADANQKAINAMDAYGQTNANQQGTCCASGGCYVPGNVTVTLRSYTDCGGGFYVSFTGANGNFSYPFPSGYYGASMDVQLPAGTYTASFYGYGASNQQFYIENPWQAWYGSNTTGQVSFSGGTTYSVNVSASCGAINNN